MRHLLASLLIFLTSASCIFIINPTIEPPTPLPPLTCGIGESEAPIAHVIFATRLERSAINLKDRYGAVMQDVVLALAAIGVEVTVGVLTRIDDQPVDQPVLAAWGCSADNPEELPPSEVLSWYMTYRERSDEPSSCAIDPLMSLGADLSNAVTQYPRGTPDGRPGIPGTSGRSVFGSAPDLVLVVYLDSLGRKIGFDDPGCDDARNRLNQDGGGAAAWLNYAGEDPPRQNVVHWFFTTEELVSRDAFVAKCKEVDGFPSTYLDALEESQTAFYGPMASALSRRGENVSALSMCKMLVEGQQRKWLKKEMESVAGILGLKVDEERLNEILAGGLPALLGGGDDPPAGGLGGIEGDSQPGR